MTSNNRARWVRPVLAAGIAVAALTATTPGAAFAAPTPIKAVALAAGQATYEQKLAVAVKFGRGDDFALIERADRDFVIEIWKHVKDNPDYLEVRAAAEEAFGTVADATNPAATDLACYEFITTGVFAAFNRDVDRERREAEAKRLSDQARAAAAASIDVVAGSDLLNGTDADFIRLIWERVAEDPKWTEVKTAAAAARNGTAEEQAQFIASGMAAAAKQAVDRRIEEDETRTEAEKAAALARAAKQLAANRIGLPVTEQLLAMPDRDFVTEVWNFAVADSEVEAAAIAAARSNDPAVWKAFIDSGIHAAKNRDIEKALAAAEAEDRRLVGEIVTRAEKVPANRNLALAARNALAGNAQVVADFLRVGQYEVRPDLPQRLQVGHTGQCLAVPSASMDTNTQLIQWPCGAGKEQGWVFYPKTGGYYELRNFNSGQCLAIGGGSKAPEGRAIQWTCNNGDEQLWTLASDSTGLTRVKNKNSSMCLAVLDGSTANAAKMVQLGCTTATSMGWNVRARGLVNVEAVSLNGDAYQDLVATEVSTGRLWLYPGTKARDAFGTRVLIGTGGWNGMDKLITGTFDGDQYEDVVAVEKSTGILWLYPGTANGTLGARVKIGNSGWNFMDRIAAGHFNNDPYLDITTVDTRDNKLYLYPGTASGVPGARVVLNGGGWGGNSKNTVGRFNRDAFDDIVSVENSTGKLWLYPGNGNGALGTRVEIGTGGWNGMNELTVGRFNGDEFDDLVATENASGKLWLYPGTTAGPGVGSRVELGIGG
ncbi:RICIN domain-containing protein [Actinoplanes sp. LDG1-06]|uniref:RICIN domain-containing protein n=1 Tax=Paractinoplanes ovalisporus TaxID=2810368 RepID=A0ABS2A543_9ACTN|nr:RICIN domain-containing protein [Actinoplanes ovalisporus]MBM2614969.1 RICIN domain-containing protein [Actinoplanes ovalisporus]